MCAADRGENTIILTPIYKIESNLGVNTFGSHLCSHLHLFCFYVPPHVLKDQNIYLSNSKVISDEYEMDQQTDVKRRESFEYAAMIIFFSL